MNSNSEIESVLKTQGFTDYKWINASDIEVAQWVRVKCQFGCSDYGLGTCPPNTPSVEECGRFFSEYSHAIVIKLTVEADKDNYPSEWSKQMTKQLLEVERQVFLLDNRKTFLLNQTCCGICKDCNSDRVNCVDKRKARPSPEAFAVDVYKTLQNAGMDMHVISTNPSEISRIAILLID